MYVCVSVSVFTYYAIVYWYTIRHSIPILYKKDAYYVHSTHGIFCMICALFLAGPDDCEFENERQITCHWRNISGYSLKWIRNKGSTPSADTGPTGDTTTNFNGSELIID